MDGLAAIEDFEQSIGQEHGEQVTFQKMDVEKFCSIIDEAVKQARVYAESELNGERVMAMRYYDGEVPDLAQTPNRSSMVSNDLRAVIAKVQPAIMRTFFGQSRIVDYVAEDIESETEQQIDEREDFLEQIASKVNKDFSATSGYQALESAVFDALINDEGALKYSFKNGIIDFKAIPPENLILTPDSRDWGMECSLIGDWSRTTRSELIAQGFNPDPVQEADESTSVMSLEDSQRFETNLNTSLNNTGVDLGEQSEHVDAYEIFARIDFDGDGIAELRHIIFINDCCEENLLLNEPVNRARVFGIRAENRPHTWRGRGLSRDVMDIQRAKTALLRAAMDNLSAINDPTTVIDLSNVSNPDDLLNRKRGAFVLLEGGKASDILYTIQVPNTAPDCFEAMKYYDMMLVDRTGVSGASNGMTPEVLQGQTATAVNMIQAGGTARVELICRNIAENGLKPMFEAVFLDIMDGMGGQLTLKDTCVNVGLGAGTRERDMASLMNVLNVQKEIMAGMGENNLYVKPENISNSLEKLVEVSGLRTPELFFHKPTPEEIAAFQQNKASQPSPEQMKIQAQTALEEKKMEAQASKEREQAVADIQVKQAEALKAEQQAQFDAVAAQRQHEERMQLEQMKLDHARELAEAKHRHDLNMHLIKSGETAIDPETGENVPTKTDKMFEFLAQLMQVSIESSNRTNALLAAPKMIIRDEQGRSMGVGIPNSSNMVN